MQEAYYKKGYCYFQLKDYKNALINFDFAIALQSDGNFILTTNDKGPMTSEEDHYQVPYGKIVYQKALVKFCMNDFPGSEHDFRISIANSYEVCSSYLWLGTINLKKGDKEKACELFQKAKVLQFLRKIKRIQKKRSV